MGLNDAEDKYEILENSVSQLIFDKVFYGYVIQQLDRKFSTEIKTAAVSFHGSNITLTVNPEFFKGLERSERVAILEHEVLHIVSDHAFRMENRDPFLWNVACDGAINQLIKGMPEGFITFSSMVAATGNPKLKKLESSEYYYGELRKAESRSGKGNKPTEYFKDMEPDHGSWGDASTVQKEMLDSIVKESYELAESDSQGWGSFPELIRKLLFERFKTKTDWTNHLNHFYQSVRSSERDPTYRRRNRRFGFMFPGYKYRETCCVVVIVDTSGSISNKDLKVFFSEVFSIRETGAKVYIIECDCDAGDPYELVHLKINNVIKGGGGSNACPAFDKAYGVSPDGIILFTDGYLTLPMKVKTPVLVLTTGEENLPIEGAVVVKYNVKNSYKL